MITRGHYIGEIIDELSNIGQQVSVRNRLGLTDLTVYAENFFRDTLNILLSCSLKNLNNDRSNEPGLDLGDETTGLGIQVTSRSDSAKVNSTLRKITAVQATKFTDIVVLVIGKKQSSYTLDAALCAKHKFNLKKIWDLDYLSRRTVGLEIERLQKLHRLVRSEVARLKVELEIPNDEGKYPTSGYDKWETIVKPKIGDGKEFVEYWRTEHDAELSDKDIADLRKAIKRLGARLARLPRITREFLVVLYERRDHKHSRRFKDPWAHLLYSKVRREYRDDDLRGELGILEHEGFVSVDGEDLHDSGPAEVGMKITDDSDDLAAGFLDFIKAKNLNLTQVIGEADLSAF